MVWWHLPHFLQDLMLVPDWMSSQLRDSCSKDELLDSGCHVDPPELEIVRTLVDEMVFATKLTFGS